MFINELMDKDVIYTYTQGIIQPLKKTHTHKEIICGNKDGPWRHYTKWNKSEKNKYFVISLICAIKKKRERSEKEIRLMVIRGRGRIKERGQKAQTSSYKIYQC